MPLTTQVSGVVDQPAMYIEWEATPWRGARIVPGIRLDYTKDTGAWDLDPRVVVRQDVTTTRARRSREASGSSRSRRRPRRRTRSSARRASPSNRAIHYDVGVEREFTRNIDVSLDGFYKQLDNLVDARGSGTSGAASSTGPRR